MFFGRGLTYKLAQLMGAGQWLNNGSCIRLRPLYKNHVWSYDFLADRTSDGRAIKILTVIDDIVGNVWALRYLDR